MLPVAPRVVSLHRYPVKSMLGERVERAQLDERGCAGDRVWSVRTASGKIGSGKSTRRFAAVHGLLDLRAATVDGRVVLTFPDGQILPADSEDAAVRLSEHVGEPVALARETAVSHFDDGPVSIVGASSVAALSAERAAPVEVARFRANVVLDTDRPFAEDEWVGRLVHIGSAVLRISMRSRRCVMVNMRTADLDGQIGNLAAIGRLNDACLGVVATVVTPGDITVGDIASLE